MDLALLLLFAITFTSILILPGPNVMFSIGQSLRYGFWGSIYVPLGFMTSTGIQATLVLSGFGTLIAKYSLPLLFLKWVGVIYLIYLAYKSFTRERSAKETVEREMSKARMFIAAVLFSLTNPKALMASILTYPVFISSDHAYIPQAVTLAVCAMIISFSIYGTYSVSASVAKKRVTKTSMGDKVVGSVYLSAAGILAYKSA